MTDAVKNLAYSTVATAPSPATSGTSLVVASGDGAKFPAVPFNATVWATGAQPVASNAEIVRVTAVSTDTLTIVRAQETGAGGPSARTIVVGDQIAATITAKTITDLGLSDPLNFMPAIGQYLAPQGLLGYGVGAAVRQRMSFFPIIIGPGPQTFDGVLTNVTTAVSGGASVVLHIGIYSDDGTGFPNTTPGPISSVDLSTFTLAKQTSNFGSAAVLQPGLYWICTIYDYGTVPTTAPQFSCNANSTWQFGVASSVTFNPHRGLVSTANTFTALPTGSALSHANMTISASTDVPIPLLHRSA